VDHKAWGSGRVLGYDGDTMTLLFDDAGYRTLSVRVVQDKDLLQPSGSDDPA
jgi:ATP-dependent DNA helicase RecQ